MNTSHEELIKRIEVLEEEIKLLKQQQAALLLQQAPRIEKEIQPNKPVVQEQKFEKERLFRPLTKVESYERAIPPRPPVEHTPKQPKKEFDFERVLRLWLPRTFMFILLLGVLWGLKVGMDNGYITNPVRIAMGYGGTILLYFVGMNYFKHKNKLFGLTLLGGLIALGILTTFAAHHLYGYLSFTVAFIIGVAYIVLGLVLSERTKSETLTLFSAIGGFLLPFLLEGEGATSFQFCAYILLLFLSLFYVSLRQQHRYTFYVTFLLFHMTLLAFAVLDGGEADRAIVVGTALIQHMALLAFYMKGKISRHVFSEALIYTNFVFALIWIKVLEAVQGNILYGAFALLYVALALYSFKKQDELLRGVFSAVAIFAVSAFVLSFDSDNYTAKTLLLLINGTVGVWIGLRYQTIRTVITGSFVYSLTALVVLLLIGINSLLSLEHVTWLVFLGSIGWIYYTLYQYPPAFLKGNLKAIDQSLLVGQIIALLYIMKLTSLALSGMSIGYLTATHTHILVLILALTAMYAFHKWERGKYLAHGVMIEFLLLGLFLIPVGLAGYFNNESFYFNLFVELLYIAILSRLFVASMKDQFYLQLKAKLSKLAIGMQVVYFIYLNKWYFAVVSYYEWELDYIFLAHTFLLFAFSFASISIGRKMDWKFVKIAGGALIAICVLKLFILDLGSVSILIRAILFTIVGIVGLLYSRTLFKDEPKDK